jgi:hypothetical protein
VVEWWGGGRGKALRLIGLSKAFLWLALVKAFLSHLTSIPDLYVHIYHGGSYIHIIGMYLPVQKYRRSGGARGEESIYPRYRLAMNVLETL